MQSSALWTKMSCGKTQSVPRIINGLRAPEHRYPWIVLVQARDEVRRLTGICGGSIITRKHVLTAGHCLFLHGERSSLSVLYGHTTLALAQRSAVVRATLHPGYDDRTLMNDIAVLELSHELQFSNRVQPVCLPTEDFPPLPGTIGIVAGWGYTSESGKQHRNPYLLFVTQAIKPQEYCVAKMQGYFYSPMTSFCAYRYGYDACQMKPYIALWFFVGVLCSAMLTAHSQACRTERQQCSPRNACCEGLACAPMFLDEKNPQLFYGNCLQSVPSSLSRAEPPKPERPPFSPRGPVLRDRQR
ncbi:mast cell protease 1A [Rhipicephalus sanguineus]|uniref:mast cell protease 1A n=1 Tax=Rhipicephalus sanguineus TaxID=34632 RepID=UPI0020C42B9D|nr:mast cell protease 1A [Rhipicephalus sanguineus]